MMGIPAFTSVVDICPKKDEPKISVAMPIKDGRRVKKRQKIGFGPKRWAIAATFISVLIQVLHLSAGTDLISFYSEFDEKVDTPNRHEIGIEYDSPNRGYTFDASASSIRVAIIYHIPVSLFCMFYLCCGTVFCTKSSYIIPWILFLVYDVANNIFVSIASCKVYYDFSNEKNLMTPSSIFALIFTFIAYFVVQKKEAEEEEEPAEMGPIPPRLMGNFPNYVLIGCIANAFLVNIYLDYDNLRRQIEPSKMTIAMEELFRYFIFFGIFANILFLLGLILHSSKLFLPYMIFWWYVFASSILKHLYLVTCQAKIVEYFACLIASGFAFTLGYYTRRQIAAREKWLQLNKKVLTISIRIVHVADL